MAEKEERFSAASKGYNDKIYEVHFVNVMDRPEYQTGPVRDGLEALKSGMEEKDFEKFINQGLASINFDPSTHRLLLVVTNEILRSLLTGRFFSAICKAFKVDNFRVVTEANGY